MHTSTAITDTTSPAIFEDLTGRDEWHGFGYLGGRRNALDGSDPEVPARPDLVARADAAILAYAAEHDWDTERLFAFCNDKWGRWFADEAFGGHGLARAMTNLRTFDHVPTTRFIADAESGVGTIEEIR